MKSIFSYYKLLEELGDQESLIKKFPKELSNNAIDKAIDEISNKAGKWFELEVISHMKMINIPGQTANEELKFIKCNSLIKCTFCENDFLGLSIADSSIVILECQMLNSGFEPRGFRHHKDAFTKGKDSYNIKLTKKVNWVFDNFDTIKSILCDNFGIDESTISRKVTCGFITYFSTMTSCFLDLFPCISLVELLDNYQKNSKWPYPNGIKRDKITIINQ